MDSSPIPSPAFTNGTQSTEMTSASSIRSNLKYHMSDIKNVFLKRATSFKVQRGRFLMLVKSYEDTHSNVLQFASLIGHLLAQNSSPHAHRLAAQVSDIFLPIGGEFRAYMVRIRLAVDMFNRLSYLEHRSNQLAAELEQLKSETASAPPAHKRTMIEECERKETEYKEFQLNFRAITETIYREIIHKIGQNICAHLGVMEEAGNSLMQAVMQFPQLGDYLKGLPVGE